MTAQARLRTLTGLALAAALLAGPVRAEQAPRPGQDDPRVGSVAYNPLNVVRIVGSPTSSTQILFAADEEITQVAIGDADGWLAQPAGTMLFVKPTGLRPPTNAQVVTRRPDGSSRSYQLQLVAAGGPAAGIQETGGQGGTAAMFAVRFRYPEDERQARAARLAETAAEARERAAQAGLAQAWADGPRNWRYVAQGSRAIEPAEVSDNGRQTAFRFPGNRRLPAIYAVAPDGSETIVPFTMSGDQLVVPTTARRFVLRDGQEVLRILNRGFDPAGRDPGTGTGTGTPGLSRSIRKDGS
ncbi:TrbG/VirB9 family P-type conjugative transfer protein [Azospirillum picis]|uniref:Type IV secretion system protein VirB9 n=1 Tax=Azospirillum picis TaxID=488438 RepID=A0ABU0MU52_9PROT|nr:TrbG/VirB9 family P-type conjugative transfer protein [Azospirillum picis]MBP2300916.1 type IV secretion system protein VirB9 [Azospirillum picis]MDQ0537020.1 type IV secretion system protein VirB9 [Azospirillum picis]